MRAEPLSGLMLGSGSIIPGLILASTIAAAASFLSEHYGAPVMLFALLIGMAFYYLSEGERCKPGVDFAGSVLLRIGVALLGVRVTLDQILSLGVLPLILVPLLVTATIFAGLLTARLLGRNWSFGLLTGGAVAICGASAALAISSVLPKKNNAECDTLFTVISVTTLSTLAMIAYPVLYNGFGFQDTQIGLLLGATIHDVAQVVGSGYAVSNEAGDVATYVKLLRVAMLPLVVMIIALSFRNKRGADRAAFPWFAVAFAVLLLVNSAGIIPETIRANLEAVSRWLLITAIAALGVKTSIKAMTDLGARHILVVVIETLFLFGIATAAVLAL